MTLDYCHFRLPMTYTAFVIANRVSDEAIQLTNISGLLRFARNDEVRHFEIHPIETGHFVFSNFFIPLYRILME